MSDAVGALNPVCAHTELSCPIPPGLSLAPFQEYLRPPEPTYIEIDMRYKRAQQKQISALGGKFDGQRQRWYVPAGQSVKPFAKWLP